MVVKIYDEASSDTKVWIPVVVNRYRALRVCQVLLHSSDTVLTEALCGVLVFHFQGEESEAHAWNQAANMS